MTDDRFARVCEALTYRFNNEAIVRAALTHRSYASEHNGPTGDDAKWGADNERLEHLGDSVLGLVITELLWQRAPEASEGKLSQLRAAVVNEGSLAEVAMRTGVGEALRLGKGEDRTGGRNRPSVLADAMEAIFAAVFLDGGFDAARRVVCTLLEKKVDEVVSRGADDYKSSLQARLQASHKITPRYKLVAVYGPDHEREHEVELEAGDVVSARGRGRSKKDAEQAAARAALEALDSASEKAS